MRVIEGGTEGGVEGGRQASVMRSDTYYGDDLTGTSRKLSRPDSAGIWTHRLLEFGVCEAVWSGRGLKEGRRISYDGIRVLSLSASVLLTLYWQEENKTKKH